jgi:radical SAM superfamily enzyme YgiQ (UPF0313 family)
LNPPGSQTFIRDYFCSKTTKSNYLFHPIDLLALSGTLALRHEVTVLDAIAERLSPLAAHQRIEAFSPDVLVTLVGSVSWLEDRDFLSEVHRRGRRILAIGDVLQENSEARLAEEPWIEAALHDFTNGDVLAYLDGNRGAVAQMTLRREGGRIERLRGGVRHSTYRIPRPRHELFPRRGYRFSFARSQRFATVLTDYGCPYPCTFCVIGTLGFKTRPVADVLEEIDDLRVRGIRELFFLDQTFGLVRERALEMCAAFAERGDLSWTAFTRPDTADAEVLGAMARAGCHTVILGVESADDTVLETYRKGYGTAQVRAAVAEARGVGLRTVGTFVIGLPEESEDSLRATLEFAIDLELDFMSLNMAVPRFGTPFRTRALGLGLAREQDLVMDQGGSRAFMPTAFLSPQRMLALKKEMVRRFYLRPGWIARRLASTRSAGELARQVREGAALLARNL